VIRGATFDLPREVKLGDARKAEPSPDRAMSSRFQ